MVSAVLSLIFGTLSLLGTVPVVLPVIGLALGANAILKEREKTDKKKIVVIMATLAIAFNGFVTVMFVLGRFLK
jgi:hypothetical protein